MSQHLLHPWQGGLEPVETFWEILRWWLSLYLDLSAGAEWMMRSASNDTLWKMLVARPSPPQVYNFWIRVLGHEEMPSQYPFLMPQVSSKQQDASCVKGILTAGLHFSADQLALWQWKVWEGKWPQLVLWACRMCINWRILFSFINELLSVEQPRGRNGRFSFLMVSG